jgi:hypothetical protein
MNVHKIPTIRTGTKASFGIHLLKYYYYYYYHNIILLYIRIVREAEFPMPLRLVFGVSRQQHMCALLLWLYLGHMI